MRYIFIPYNGQQYLVSWACGNPKGKWLVFTEDGIPKKIIKTMARFEFIGLYEYNHKAEKAYFNELQSEDLFALSIASVL